MNEITIGDKVYISAKRASEITGYVRDYVGQLCREGHVDAKMVGRSWYVYEPSIRAHRFGEQEIEPSEGDNEVDLDAKSKADIETEGVEKPESDENIESERGRVTTATWQRPIYKAEVVETIPEMRGREAVVELVEPEAALTDMQSAWKEWFERKQQEDTAETTIEEDDGDEIEPIETGIDADDDEDEVDEAEEEAEEAEPIAIHRVRQSAQQQAYHHEPVQREMDIIAPVPVIPAHTPPYVPVAAPAPVYAPIAASEMSGEPEGRVVAERVVRRNVKGVKGKQSRNTSGQRSYMPISALLIAICLVVLAITAIGTGFASKYIEAYVGDSHVINFLVGTSEYQRD